MDVIRSNTNEIYKTFWLDYDKYNKKFKGSYNELEELFNLFFFIIDKTTSIVQKKCENYEDILSILSILSLFFIEMRNYLLKNNKFNNCEINPVMKIFMDNSCFINDLDNKSIENVLFNDENNEIIVEQNKKSKENIYNLYLKLKPFI